MKELRIQSVIRKKRRFFGKQSSVVHPNRLDRQFTAKAPNEKWVTDITYLPFGESFLYLSAIQDLHNNERFQKKLGDRSPVEYRKAIAA